MCNQPMPNIHSVPEIVLTDMIITLLSNNYSYTEYKISAYSELLSSTCWARATNLEKSTSGRSLQVYKNELNNPNYSRKSYTITDALQVEFWV